ncbi:unnamed protein product [Fraxinus pennsylvanica]|uniref:DUF506 family protein n=1 Tax=Fraxinus pennsylvanica TaxID=56036 RepID=A0AAD1ZN54_9LAMI|nr:unnamed protein product [Fraxinus pennsylvanica]
MGTPVKFQRLAAVFEEAARNKESESSGSEHSPESLTDLSDLVNSFLEREEGETEENDQEREVESEQENNCPDFELLKNDLESLIESDEEDIITRNIHVEVEKACREIGNSSLPDFKRRLMARLRHRGFDAGLCKSKWEKTGGCPSGDYEYIDAYVSGTRFIIEVFLAGEFTIARPTSSYTSLLEVFPSIYVGKMDQLKKVVRLMCRAMRKSLKTNGLHLSPWRRLACLQLKWFGSYRRTINEIPGRTVSDSGEGLSRKSLIGFVPVPVISYKCREDLGSRVGGRVGNFAASIWPFNPRPP